MGGIGPPPKAHRQRPRDEKRRLRGDWQTVTGVGWQHGPLPDPPDGLLPASLEAWRVWFSAWFAAHWTPGDLPGLREVVRLYDQIERGESRASDHREFHAWARSYGITPDGQLALRWQRPGPEPRPTPEASPVPDSLHPLADHRMTSRRTPAWAPFHSARRALPRTLLRRPT